MRLFVWPFVLESLIDSAGFFEAPSGTPSATRSESDFVARSASGSEASIDSEGFEDSEDSEVRITRFVVRFAEAAVALFVETAVARFDEADVAVLPFFRPLPGLVPRILARPLGAAASKP